MGYIFDALNKKQGDSAKGDNPQEPIEDAAPQTGIASAMDDADNDVNTAQDDAHEHPALRLADVKLSIDSDNADGEPASITAVMAEQALPPLAPIQMPDQDAQAPQPAEATKPTAAIDTDAPVQVQINTPPKPGGWWNRLLGKHLRGKVDDRLVTINRPASAVAEEYRSIRTSILARHDNERHLVHTISSATPQEGKTITCVNLGLSFAELRNRATIIIECDLRLPTFGKLLNLETDAPGLIDYLRGDAKLKDVIQQVEGSSLCVLPAGGRVSDEAVQLLSSQRMSQLIQGLRAKFDHVIIDTPPVLTLADAGILGSQSEEVLLVARMRRTPRTLVEQAVNTLTSYNATVSGVIATDNPRSRGKGYGYKYGYRYGYGYGYGYTDDRQRDRKRKSQAA